MDVQLAQETVSIPAESKAVKDLLVDIVSKLKSGTPIATLALQELPALEVAVKGYAALPSEFRDVHEPVLAGLLAGQIASALRG